MVRSVDHAGAMIVSEMGDEPTLRLTLQGFGGVDRSVGRPYWAHLQVEGETTARSGFDKSADKCAGATEH
jgi:hypothetical protein